MTVSVDDFMSGAKASPLSGNTAWAQRYAGEIRRIVTEHAARAPRSQQVHLGPSEIGVDCDRQIVGKLVGLPATNHVTDPWPSIVGTAVHAWLAEAYTVYNTRAGVLRFLAEQRVVPHPDHSGTADLYDALEFSVDDHKVLGESSMAKVRKPGGPPIKYVVQLLAYAEGYRALGFRVDRVALIAYPRTASSLDGLYVWERPHTPADDQLLDKVWAQMAQRKVLAASVRSGGLNMTDIPTAPNDDECYFCPFYRPQTARDGGPGCPGPRKTQP